MVMGYTILRRNRTKGTNKLSERILKVNVICQLANASVRSDESIGDLRGYAIRGQTAE